MVKLVFIDDFYTSYSNESISKRPISKRQGLVEVIIRGGVLCDH